MSYPIVHKTHARYKIKYSFVIVPKNSTEQIITPQLSEQVAFSKPVTDVKLSVEKKYFESKQGSLEEIASKVVSEGMDPVNKDAVKKKFDDRKDKDIDNDGDTDSTDKYLHKRRAAISKATEAVSPAQQAAIAISKKERGEKPKNEAVTQDDHGEKINQDKKDAAMKKTDQKKDFKSLRAETKIIKLGDKGKTDTGKDAAVIDVEPSAKPI